MDARLTEAKPLQEAKAEFIFIEGFFFFFPRSILSVLLSLFLSDGTETQKALLPVSQIQWLTGTGEITQTRASMRAALPPKKPQGSFAKQCPGQSPVLPRLDPAHRYLLNWVQ